MDMSRDQNAGQSHSIKLIIAPLNGWKSSNIREQTSQIKIRFRKKLRADEVTECLPSFDAESFVFQFGNQKFRDKINRTIIWPVALRRYETWSLTLREERRLRVFERRGVAEEYIWA
jgi:hypothetical protein